MENQNVEDDDELHDLDLISGDTCKGDPPTEPKRVRTEPPKSKALPTFSSRKEENANAVNFNMQLALCSSSGPMVSG